jgi:septum formation protein
MDERNAALHVVLGSRSPQRLALLRQLLPQGQITVCPPRSAAEQGFAGLETWSEIETRLRDIARAKCADVWDQCREQGRDPNTLILTADTVILAEDGPRQIVLGQPPEANWKETTRIWFQKYLLGKTHKAATAVCLSSLSGVARERLVVSEVTFCPDDGGLLEWYLETEEPRGKAGGYGIQRAGSVFVTRLEGSLSNVIGLPQRETWEMLEDLRAEMLYRR